MIYGPLLSNCFEVLQSITGYIYDEEGSTLKQKVQHAKSPGPKTLVCLKKRTAQQDWRSGLKRGEVGWQKMTRERKAGARVSKACEIN